MTMAGISSKALAFGNPENKRGYNGNEIQNREFSDGSGLEFYDFKFRGFDPQIGRFMQVDPLADMSFNYSPYAYGNNNPILFNDPLGLASDTAWKVLQEVVVSAKQKVSNFTNWFTGRDVGYTGSGWGHGPRRWLADQYGLGNKANNLFELGLHSQLQSSQVNLTGNLLDKIKADPDLIRHQNAIIKILKADPRFGKIAFISKGAIKGGVEFGGKRWGSKNENWGVLNENNPLLHGETWQVAANELTWATRHAVVDYVATVKSDGTIVIAYHLNDTLDLSAQKGRSEAYNNISSATGFLYHDVTGGNSAIKVNADWQTVIK